MIVAPHYQDVQLQWVCPEGVWESGDPTISNGVSLLITNSGNIASFPIITIEGPHNGEVTITNSASGDILSMPDLEISSGHSVVIDNRQMAIYDGLTARYDVVDWSVSDWLTLVPGVNEFTIEGAVATIESRSTWL